MLSFCRPSLETVIFVHEDEHWWGRAKYRWEGRAVKFAVVQPPLVVEGIQVSASPASLGLVISPPLGSYWLLEHAVESIFSGIVFCLLQRSEYLLEVLSVYFGSAVF